MQNQLRYNSQDELEQDFQRRIASEQDPLEKANLLAAKADAMSVFREQTAQRTLEDAWRKMAVMDYPLAKTFPSLITGSTEDEIRESAKAVHQQITELQTQNDGSTFDKFRQQMNDQGNPYGRAGVIGGGAQPGSAYVPPDMQRDRWQRQFAERFNDAPLDSYGQRTGLSPRDIDRYTQERFVDHITDKVALWGQLTRSDMAGMRRR